jgi:hypothetical protein
MLQKSSCQLGAAHTWHEAADLECPRFGRYLPNMGFRRHNGVPSLYECIGPFDNHTPSVEEVRQP